MTIQDSIIQALQASHEAHQAGLTALVASQTAHQAALVELDQLRTDKASLEARVAELETAVAYHQAESVKIVDPEIVNPLLEWLSRAVEATHSAIPQATPSTPAADASLPGDAAVRTPDAEHPEPQSAPAAEARPVEPAPAEPAPVANQNVPAPAVAPAVAMAAPVPPHPEGDTTPAVVPHIHPVVLQFEDVELHDPERTTPHERDGDKVG